MPKKNYLRWFFYKPKWLIDKNEKNIPILIKIEKLHVFSKLNRFIGEFLLEVEMHGNFIRYRSLPDFNFIYWNYLNLFEFVRDVLF